MPAGDGRVRVVATAAMPIDHGRSDFTGEMLIAPLVEGHHDRIEVLALLCQAVLKARRMRRVLVPLEDSGLEQTLQSIGHNTGLSSGAFLEAGEARLATERFAHDH